MHEDRDEVVHWICAAVEEKQVVRVF